MKKKIILLLMALTTSIFAFDGNRKGFVLGFGAGYQNSNENLTYDFWPTVDVNTNGLYTHFKIGYGFNENFILYYSRPAHWSTYEDYISKEFKLNGLTGIGGAYYFNGNGASPYVFGAIGIADSFINPWAYEDGDAYQIGVGYEFSNQTSVEVAYYSATFNGRDIYGDVNSLSFSINYLFY